MAANVTLDWSKPLGSNDGTLSLWLAEVGNLTPVGSPVDGTSFEVFEDEDTDAFIGLETLEPDDALRYAEVLRAQPYPPVDVPQAGLKDVHPAEALLWAVEHLRPAKAPTGTMASMRPRRSIYSRELSEAKLAERHAARAGRFMKDAATRQYNTIRRKRRVKR